MTGQTPRSLYTDFYVLVDVIDWSAVFQTLTATTLIRFAHRHTHVWLSLVVEPTTVGSSSNQKNITRGDIILVDVIGLEPTTSSM